MIYDFFTGKKETDFNKCDMCRHNLGYLIKDKTMIWCDKQLHYEKNDKSVCKYNTYKSEGG